MKKFYINSTSLFSKLLIVLFLFNSPDIYAQEFMRANLYIVDPYGITLVDGNMTNYSPNYSNSIDIYDALKLSNPGINFGISRNGYDLAVERRHTIESSDTTFFRMWNMQQHNYRIRFVLVNLNHPGLHVFLKDTYLNTETSLEMNDTSYVDFSIDANPASANDMRFQLIYTMKNSVFPDIVFAGIKVKRDGCNAMLHWEMKDEILVRSYDIEHSQDGLNFETAELLSANNTGGSSTYDYSENVPFKTGLYYRIKAIGTSGKIQYSEVARLTPGANRFEMKVYPNPIVNNIANVQLSIPLSGKYEIILIHMNGMKQQLSSLQLSEGVTNISVSIPKYITPGIYRLQITGTGISKLVSQIQVL